MTFLYSANKTANDTFDKTAGTSPFSRVFTSHAKCSFSILTPLGGVRGWAA